jgi:hypothetical protein
MVILGFRLSSEALFLPVRFSWDWDSLVQFSYLNFAISLVSVFSQIWSNFTFYALFDALIKQLSAFFEKHTQTG